MEDFAPEVEIGGIMKGINVWEGEKFDLGIVVQSLPLAVRGVVLREMPEAAAAMREAGKGFGVKMRKRAEELLQTLEVRVEGVRRLGVCIRIRKGGSGWCLTRLRG